MIRARRMCVNRVRDQFLAGSGFARDQDRRAAGRHLRHQIQNLEHPVALAHDVREAGPLPQGPLELGVFRFQLALRDHAPDLDHQLFVIPRLRKVIVRPALQRAHCSLHRPVSGDQENGRLPIAHPHFVQNFQAALVRHHQVQQHQVVVRRLQPFQAFGRVRRERYAIALGGQQHFQAFADVGFIVDD